MVIAGQTLGQHKGVLGADGDDQSGPRAQTLQKRDRGHGFSLPESPGTDQGLPQFSGVSAITPPAPRTAPHPIPKSAQRSACFPPGPDESHRPVNSESPFSRAGG